MVHDLQQDVVDVGVRLLDLVEQHHAVGVGADRVDQLSALLESDVSGRRADQPGDGVLLHVLGHVEADELVAQLIRQLLGELGLADAGRAREQEAARRTVGMRQPGSRALDRLRHLPHGIVLSEDDAAERFFERPQPLTVGGGRLSRGNARDARDDALDVGGVDRRTIDLRRRGVARRLTAPASSMRSMALSGRRASRRCRAASRAAASSAASV